MHGHLNVKYYLRDFIILQEETLPPPPTKKIKTSNLNNSAGNYRDIILFHIIEKFWKNIIQAHTWFVGEF